MQSPYFFLLLFTVSVSTVHAQVIGKIFPDMEAETIEDNKVKLPDNVKGKYTLLGLAYSKKSEDELNSWFQPVFQKFIQKNKGLFEGFGYDVNVYFIPMFTGINTKRRLILRRKTSLTFLFLTQMVKSFMQPQVGIR